MVMSDEENVISCPSLVGAGLTEAAMKSLVVRGHGPEVLADACRGQYGYTTGAGVGAILSIDVNSGRVAGARFTAIAEAGVPLLEVKVPASKIWHGADKKLEVNIRVMPNDLVFSAEAGDKRGSRCVSDWVDAMDNDHFTVSTLGDKGTRGRPAEAPAVVDKSLWKDHEGVKEGAAWRLMLEPESTERVKLRLMVTPVSKEELIRLTTENGTIMADPALPAISMASNMKQRLFPRESSFTSGLGFLPLLYYNTGEEELVLPGKGDIKKELFSLLRDVVKPNVVKADKWREEFNETHWKEVQGPTVVWPAPPADRAANPGELNTVKGDVG